MAGQLKQDIQNGSSVEIRIKYHGIRVFKRSFSICDELKEIGLGCPMSAGPFAFNKTLTIPDKSIPRVRFPLFLEPSIIRDETLADAVP